MEIMENLEGVKSIAESNVKICLIENIPGFHDKGILQIFYRSLVLLFKQKIHHPDFP